MPKDAELESGWQRFHEPLWRTLARNVTLALAVGVVLALFRGRPSLVGLIAFLALWFTLGGHYAEVMYLNIVRGRVPKTRSAQVFARLAFWFACGCALFLGMNITAQLLSFDVLRYRALWLGGVLLVGIELVVHLISLFRGKPNFYAGTA